MSELLVEARSSALLLISYDFELDHFVHFENFCVAHSASLVLVLNQDLVAKVQALFPDHFPRHHRVPECTGLVGQEQAGHFHVVLVV